MERRQFMKSLGIVLTLPFLPINWRWFLEDHSQDYDRINQWYIERGVEDRPVDWILLANYIDENGRHYNKDFSNPRYSTYTVPAYHYGRTQRIGKKMTFYSSPDKLIWNKIKTITLI